MDRESWKTDWSEEERKQFLAGLRQHGEDWEAIAKLLGDKPVEQVESAGKEYFSMVAKAARESGKKKRINQGRPWWMTPMYPVFGMHYAMSSIKPNVFHKILQGKLGTELLHEDDQVIAFRDIFPLGDTHILVIPREHIHSWPSLEVRHIPLVEHMKEVGHEIMRREGFNNLEEECHFGFMTPPFNSVMQLHLHCLSLPLKGNGSTIDKLRIGSMSSHKMVDPDQVLEFLTSKASL